MLCKPATIKEFPDLEEGAIASTFDGIATLVKGKKIWFKVKKGSRKREPLNSIEAEIWEAMAEDIE